MCPFCNTKSIYRITWYEDDLNIVSNLQNLERQLEGQRPLLADLEAAGEALGAVLGEPSARQDVASKLTGAVRQFEALQRRLDMAKAEAEAALK